MAKVKIMYWKDIPYGVRAFDENGRVTRQLPEAFAKAIDAAAMVDGDTEEDTYRAGFTWGPAEEREGTATEVADAVTAEIITAYPKSRLNKLSRRQEA
jgi:hypothetical protein